VAPLIPAAGLFSFLIASGSPVAMDAASYWRRDRFRRNGKWSGAPGSAIDGGLGDQEGGGGIW